MTTTTDLTICPFEVHGIGLAIVRGLAAAGARVIVGARESSADLDELREPARCRSSWPIRQARPA